LGVAGKLDTSTEARRHFKLKYAMSLKMGPYQENNKKRGRKADADDSASSAKRARTDDPTASGSAGQGGSSSGGGGGGTSFADGGGFGTKPTLASPGGIDTSILDGQGIDREDPGEGPPPAKAACITLPDVVQYLSNQRTVPRASPNVLLKGNQMLSDYQNTHPW